MSSSAPASASSPLASNASSARCRPAFAAASSGRLLQDRQVQRDRRIAVGIEPPLRPAPRRRACARRASASAASATCGARQVSVSAMRSSPLTVTRALVGRRLAAGDRCRLRAARANSAPARSPAAMAVAIMAAAITRARKRRLPSAPTRPDAGFRNVAIVTRPRQPTSGSARPQPCLTSTPCRPLGSLPGQQLRNLVTDWISNPDELRARLAAAMPAAERASAWTPNSSANAPGGRSWRWCRSRSATERILLVDPLAPGIADALRAAAGRHVGAEGHAQRQRGPGRVQARLRRGADAAVRHPDRRRAGRRRRRRRLPAAGAGHARRRAGQGRNPFRLAAPAAVAGAARIRRRRRAPPVRAARPARRAPRRTRSPRLAGRGLRAHGRQRRSATNCERWPHLSLRAAQFLDRDAQLRLLRLLRWRDAYARDNDRPRNWILDNELAAVARAQSAGRSRRRCSGSSTPRRKPRASSPTPSGRRCSTPLADEADAPPPRSDDRDKPRLRRLQDAVAARSAELGLPDGVLASRRWLEAAARRRATGPARSPAGAARNWNRRWRRCWPRRTSAPAATRDASRRIIAVFHGGGSSAGRAPRSHRGGQGFDPPPLHH